LGFFRAQIRPKFNEGIDDKWVTVRFFIYEGPRYAVRSVTFLGNEKIPTARLATDLKLTDGQPFDQVKLNKDIAKVRDEYGGEGYVFADIKPDTRFLEEPGKVDLVYTIKEGARYRIGRVNVVIEGEGAHTRRKTILNHVSLRPGDIADIRQIRSSQNRLQRSGLFEMDPSRGIAPQIKFARANDPNSESGRTAKGRSGVRGQSPDNTERWIDLTIE
jgi:outer membrane protein insertion porin family